MSKVINELCEFDEDRMRRVTQYNRLIQDYRGCSDSKMADLLFVSPNTYSKTGKYKVPLKGALKYVNLHYELDICLDRCLADDTRFDLFMENNASSGICVPKGDLAGELQKLLRFGDSSLSEEEKFWIAADISSMLLKWLSYGDEIRRRYH